MSIPIGLRPGGAARAVILLIACLTASSAGASTFRVDATADEPDVLPGDGRCATTEGTCTLRAAVQEANAFGGEDWIILPSGTFTFSIAGAGEDVSATGDLDLSDSVTIGGAGSATVIDAAGLDRIFEIHPAASRVAIESMTLRNGLVAAAAGGAIRGNGRSIQIANVAFLGNSAADGGAMAFTSRGLGSWFDCTVRRSSFDGNRAGNRGGAIASEYGYLTIAHSTFGTVSGNAAGGDGGAIYVEVGRLVVDWATLANNAAGGKGGAIHVTGSGARASVSTSMIRDNSAQEGGGIYSCCRGWFLGGTVSAALDVSVSTFARNRALRTGGAIFVDGDLRISHSTLSGNSAVKVGGIEFLDGFISFGWVEKSILNDAAGNCSGGGAALMGRFNVIGDDSCLRFKDPQGNLHSTDPRLGPLADNGGPTSTFAPLPGSPATDLIPRSVVFVDQRGFARPAGAGWDAGAVELTTAAPVATTTRLVARSDPLVAGRPVELEAFVTPDSRWGQVVFRDRGIIVGTADRTSGVVVLRLPSLEAGSHSITASFTGDSAFAPSVSEPLVIEVLATAATVPTLDTALLILLGVTLVLIGCRYATA